MLPIRDADARASSQPWWRVHGPYVATILLAAIAVAVWLGSRYRPNPVDDAYITFTYAKSAITGQGLVYPIGARILASTSPLFTLMLAASSAGRSPAVIPGVAMWLDIIALALSAILCYAVCASLGPAQRRAGLLAGILLLLNSRMQAACLGGMEGPMLAMWILLACWLCLQRYQLASGIAIGLALLTRPEGALVGLPILAWTWWTTRRFPWKLAAGGAAVVVPWTIFSIAWFGSPIPHNLVVKLAAFHHYDAYPGATLRVLLSDLPELVGWYRADKSAIARDSLLQYPAVLAGTAALLLCAWAFARRAPGSLLVSGTALLYLAFHGLGNKLYFGWYSVPLVPLLLLPLVGGVVALLDRATAKQPRATLLTRAALVLIGLLVAVSHAGASARLDERYRIVLVGASSRELQYQKAAELLNARASAVEAVALPEIGVFGFYTAHRPIDLVGLATPEVLPWRKAGEDYWQIARRFDPRWVVTHRAYADPFVNDQGFRARYRPIFVLEDVLIFERAPADAAPSQP